MNFDSLWKNLRWISNSVVLPIVLEQPRTIRFISLERHLHQGLSSSRSLENSPGPAASTRIRTVFYLKYMCPTKSSSGYGTYDMSYWCIGEQMSIIQANTNFRTSDPQLFVIGSLPVRACGASKIFNSKLNVGIAWWLIWKFPVSFNSLPNLFEYNSLKSWSRQFIEANNSTNAKGRRLRRDPCSLVNNTVLAPSEYPFSWHTTILYRKLEGFQTYGIINHPKAWGVNFWASNFHQLRKPRLSL